MGLLLEQLVQHFNAKEKLTRISKQESALMRSGLPDLPDVYVQFLEQGGYGDLGKIILYSGPVEALEIYPESLTHLAKILLIGDDSQGYCFGFNPEARWQIVEINPRGELVADMEADFIALLNRFA